MVLCRAAARGIKASVQMERGAGRGEGHAGALKIVSINVAWCISRHYILCYLGFTTMARRHSVMACRKFKIKMSYNQCKLTKSPSKAVKCN